MNRIQIDFIPSMRVIRSLAGTALIATVLLIAAPAAVAATAAASLPDFTGLVAQAGPAVVNVEATLDGNRRTGGNLPEDVEIPEFFRRFFGQPGMPGAPGAPGMPELPDRTSAGSGFIISADGYVLTNHHVIADANEITVRLSDRRELRAKVVGSDPQSDVALLKIDAGGLPTLALGDSRNLRPGQWVIAIGSPFGFDHSVTAGIVSGLGRPSIDRSQQYVPFIQTDVAINRGNSGGPLLDTSGRVVGINSQIFSNSGGYMGVSFAIPIETAMNAVEQLKKTGKVTRGQLGVQIENVDSDKARGLGLNRPGGALVNTVLPGSAAERAGIQIGDVIVAFNDQEVARSSSLPPMVGAVAPGTRVSVRVKRAGKTLDLPVTLSALGDADGGDDVRIAAAPAASAAGNTLGLTVEALGTEQRAQLELKPGEGVLVTAVGGAARQAGLRPGDVLLMLDRKPIGSVAQFNTAAKAVKPGDTAMLLMRRGAATSFFALTPRANAGE